MKNYIVYYRTGYAVRKVRVGFFEEHEPTDEQIIKLAKGSIKRCFNGKLPEGLQIMSIEKIE